MSRRRIVLVLCGLLVLLLPFLAVQTPAVEIAGNRFTFGLLTFSHAVVLMVAVLSLVVLIGFNGQVSLGSAFFMGVGAYGSIILSNAWGVPILLTPLIMGPLCALVGFCVGFPALRIQGPYLALVTLTLTAVFPALVRMPALRGLTHGSNGLLLADKIGAPAWLAEVPRVLGSVPLLGGSVFGTRDLSPKDAATVFTFYLMVAIAIVVFLLTKGIVSGATGRAIRAVRDHQIGAEGSGVPAALLKTKLFGYSAGVAGVAGSMYAMVFGIVAPDTFGILFAIYLLFGMIAGGSRQLAGAVVGGVLVAFLPSLTGQITTIPGVPEKVLHGPLATAILGLLLIVLSMTLPKGIAGQWADRRARRQSAAPPVPPTDDDPPEPVAATAGHSPAAKETS